MIALVVPLLTAGCMGGVGGPAASSIGRTSPAVAGTASTDTASTGAARSASGGATDGTITETGVAAYVPSAHAHLAVGASPDRMLGVAPAATPPGFVQPPAGSGMQRYLDQRLTWAKCGEFRCATVVVPLDWDRPDGRAITLALKMAPAQQAANGVLFINPGGPGASGLDMLTGFDNSDYPAYDVVAWDPRGSGESTPVACGTPVQTDALNDADFSPDTPAEWSRLETLEKSFAQECRAASGVLLDHISTIDTARDLDYLRALMHDPVLNYLGISYGTFIGAVYAELYPHKVGRMVLDSAVDITGNDSVIQAMGFDLALKNFATWCIPQGCRLGTTVPELLGRLTSALNGLDAHPLPTASGRPLTQSEASMGIAYYLYGGARSYTALLQALVEFEAGDASTLLAASDALSGREHNGTYDSIAYAFPAISCADRADRGVAGERAAWSVDEKKAPFFGTYFGPDLTCVYWTAEPADQVKITATGSAPIIVVGTTGDPATPYQQAVSMAKQLADARLVTWRGARHSAYGSGDACVRHTVWSFLNSGSLPVTGKAC